MPRNRPELSIPVVLQGSSLDALVLFQLCDLLSQIKIEAVADSTRVCNIAVEF